jgi:hypothetical protein
VDVFLEWGEMRIWSQDGRARCRKWRIWIWDVKNQLIKSVNVFPSPTFKSLSIPSLKINGLLTSQEWGDPPLFPKENRKHSLPLFYVPKKSICINFN